MLKKYKKILIVGDAGRGKSTLAIELSKKLRIKSYATDDFFWKKKFSVREDRKQSMVNISKVYDQDKDSWIVEGSTRSLVEGGLAKAEIIVCLKYPNLITQFWNLYQRNRTRDNESIIDLFKLYKHLILKKFKIGDQKNKLGIEEMIKKYNEKVVCLKSFAEVDDFRQSLEN